MEKIIGKHAGKVRKCTCSFEERLDDFLLLLQKSYVTLLFIQKNISNWNVASLINYVIQNFIITKHQST